MGYDSVVVFMILSFLMMKKIELQLCNYVISNITTNSDIFLTMFEIKGRFDPLQTRCIKIIYKRNFHDDMGCVSP